VHNAGIFCVVLYTSTMSADKRNGILYRYLSCPNSSTVFFQTLFSTSVNSQSFYFIEILDAI